VALLYNLLLELDIYYSTTIQGLDEAMRKKMHNVFMSSPEGYMVSDGGFF
jgi:hypothetical protein